MKKISRAGVLRRGSRPTIMAVGTSLIHRHNSDGSGRDDNEIEFVRFVVERPHKSLIQSANRAWSRCLVYSPEDDGSGSAYFSAEGVVAVLKLAPPRLDASAALCSD